MELDDVGMGFGLLPEQDDSTGNKALVLSRGLGCSNGHVKFIVHGLGVRHRVWRPAGGTTNTTIHT